MRISLPLCICFTVAMAVADTHYVSLDGADVHPFDSWANAATNIQSAVDAASDNDTVLVSNGLYRVGATPAVGHTTSNRVMIPAAISVESLSGPAQTVIAGQGPMGSNAIRCVYLVDGAQVVGFTLSNGHVRAGVGTLADSRGGGVLMDNGGVVSNCMIAFNMAPYGGGACCFTGGVVRCSDIVSNVASAQGGGVHIDADGEVRGCVLHRNAAPGGGGLSTYGGGLISNSAVIANYGTGSGGGVMCAYSTIVHSCAIKMNVSDGTGGGVQFQQGCLMQNCTVSSNCSTTGGGIYSYSSIIRHTIIDSNIASNGSGGGVHCSQSELRNCLVIRNTASPHSGNGGGVYCDYQNKIESCTISGNSAYMAAGVYLGYNNWVVNSIVYGNLPGGNYNAFGPDNTFTYTCTAPIVVGEGNIDENPEFVDYLNADYRLQHVSPCIDNGYNFAWMTTGVDLDRNERIYNVIVDMGAYEWIPEPSIFVIGCWLLAIGYLRRRCSE